MKKLIGVSLFAGVTVLVISSCGGSSSGSSFTVSGQLAVSASRRADEKTPVVRDVTSYTVDCTTLVSSGTPTACSGTADSSGNFSCGPLPDGVPFGCFVEQSGSIVAVMAFTAATEGVNGSTAQGTIVAGGGTTGLSLGTVSVNLTTGTAVVNMANVTATGGSAPATTSTGVSSWANVERTGGWTIAALPSSQVPAGAHAPCAAGTQNCNGPEVGQPVFLAQYQATDTSNNTHLGVAIWNGSGATPMTNYSACVNGTSTGEGAQLPTGLTAVAGANNNAAALTLPLNLTAAIPAPTASRIFSPNSGGTMQACGVNNSSASSDTKTCDQIATEPGYTNSNGSQGADQCIFLCVMNNIGHIVGDMSCGGNAHVDWGAMGNNVFSHSGFDPQYSGGHWSDASSQVSFAADSSPPSGALKSFFGGALVFEGGNPNNRFLFGELIVQSGGIGSLSSQQPSQTFNICTIPPNGTGCPQADQVQCTITEVDQLTMTQTGTDASGAANKMVVQLIQNVTLSSNNDTACTNAINQGNGGGPKIGQSIYAFQLNGN